MLLAALSEALGAPLEASLFHMTKGGEGYKEASGNLQQEAKVSARAFFIADAVLLAMEDGTGRGH